MVPQRDPHRLPDAVPSATPTPLPAADNQAALRALGIRAKLTISQPSDPDEREADQAADAFAAGRPLQRKCAASGCDDEMVMRSAAHAAAPVSAGALGGLRASTGTGLPPTERRRYESFFGADLSRVRLHTGDASARAARAIGANAFTVESDVHFAAGQRKSGTEGEKLLAHELAHVVQRPLAAGADVVHRDALTPLPPSRPDFMALPSPSFASDYFATAQGLDRPTFRPWQGGDASQGLVVYDEPGPDTLQFTDRFFGPDVVRPDPLVRSCSMRGGCHQPDSPVRWTPPPDRRATDARLLKWALDMGRKLLLTDGNQFMLQLFPGEYAGFVAALHDQLRMSILKTHEFEGSDTARQRGADALDWRWEEVRPDLEQMLETWFIAKYGEAIQRAPAGAKIVSEPADILRALTKIYAGTTDTGRWGQLARAGERWGAMVIQDIGWGTVWFHLHGHPEWLYEMSTVDFRKWDPFVAEVARQTAENARFAMELWPFMIKMFGIGLGMSGNLAFVIAGIVIEEFAEEYQRDIRGQEHRSWSEILTSAGKSLLIDRVANRLLGGGPKALEAGAEKAVARGAVTTAEEKIVGAVEEKAAQAIRREVAAAEGPKIASAARSGAVRNVEDAALRKQGYVVEVEVISEGRRVLYRQLDNGKWCRFGSLICGLDMDTAVAGALKTPSERALETTVESITAVRKDQSLIVQAYTRVAPGARKGRFNAALLTDEERAVLDELAPTGHAADLTVRDLEKLATRKVEHLHEYKVLVEAEAQLIAKIAREARPLGEKIRALLKRTTKDQVKSESRGLDFISQASPRPGDTLSVEHIVPVREMSELPGIRELADRDPDALIEFANLRRNLVPMSHAANITRQDTRYAELLFSKYEKYGYTVKRLEFMSKEEIEVRQYLVNWIAERLKPKRTR